MVATSLTFLAVSKKTYCSSGYYYLPSSLLQCSLSPWYRRCACRFGAGYHMIINSSYFYHLWFFIMIWAYCKEKGATSTPLGYCAILVLVIIHKNYNWVGLLVASVLWKLTSYLLLSWKLILRSKQAWIIWVLCLTCIVFSAIGTFQIPLGGSQVQQKWLIMFYWDRGLLAKHDQQLQRRCLIPDIGTLLYGAWLISY